MAAGDWLFRVVCEEHTIECVDEEDAYARLRLAMVNGCEQEHFAQCRVVGGPEGWRWTNLYSQSDVRRMLMEKEGWR